MDYPIKFSESIELIECPFCKSGEAQLVMVGNRRLGVKAECKSCGGSSGVAWIKSSHKKSYTTRFQEAEEAAARFWNTRREKPINREQPGIFLGDHCPCCGKPDENSDHAKDVAALNYSQPAYLAGYKDGLAVGKCEAKEQG